ncbi:NAD(P)H-dependent oxidoreductase [Streptomyces sp. H39-S7]|uniref:NAD(P)H-dependent oxidoreductase n=1 Tax=Streptomyces sp. H39-S7 TaxID=3004357 RepID=UPI0022B01C85|nr:NAD(P)H-dependent oxidoreductase [Streptomyces sp. H39-S7]MCZ4124777.1 NAD(P)H-dependent oxidoreductase [Streptomyces sp. H39-S7]
MTPRLDTTRGRPFPAMVDALRDGALRADVLLIVTPEFSREVPGGLADFIDLLSILIPPTVLAGKPVALRSASPNRFGGTFSPLQLGHRLRPAGAEILTDRDPAVRRAHRPRRRA